MEFKCQKMRLQHGSPMLCTPVAASDELKARGTLHEFRRFCEVHSPAMDKELNRFA